MTPPNVAIYNWIRQGLDFKGRSSRSDYWWPRVMVLTVNLVLLFVFTAGLGPEKSQVLIDWLASNPTTLEGLEEVGPLPSMSLFALVFVIVFGLFTLIPDIAVAWRRFQDMDRPGWLHIVFLVLGAFVPFVALVEYGWFAVPGTDGENRYGPDPTQRWR
ncbi:MAG: DUF805 domain-containing protein [Litorimonas sp.]